MARLIFEYMIMPILSQLKKENRPTPIARRRRVPLGKVVIECPSCGKLAMSKYFRVEEKAPNRGAEWEMVVELCICGACKQPVETAVMVCDKSGVLHVRQWNCPRCNTPNSQLGRFCLNCKKPNPDPYIPGETERFMLGDE